MISEIATNRALVLETSCPARTIELKVPPISAHTRTSNELRARLGSRTPRVLLAFARGLWLGSVQNVFTGFGNAFCILHAESLFY
jgi:hypothetical protein